MRYPEVPEQARADAAAQWHWAWLFSWLDADDSILLTVLGPLFRAGGFGLEIVRRLFGRRETRPEDVGRPFVAFHRDQSDALTGLYLLGGLFSCGVGFFVLAPFALFVRRQGRLAAERGQWKRFPLLGWFADLPPISDGPERPSPPPPGGGS